jgi:hypothetical protein
VIAIVAALGLGALAVGTIRIAFDDDAPAAVTSVQSPLWDAQKLEAMEGRQLAEQVGTQAPLWDAQKLEAMEGRMLAEQEATVGAVVPVLEPGELKAMLEGRVLYVGPQTTGWDAAKLEAMEGRMLAEQVGAEDPILVPHVPRRAPQV